MNQRKNKSTISQEYLNGFADLSKELVIWMRFFEFAVPVPTEIEFDQGESTWDSEMMDLPQERLKIEEIAEKHPVAFNYFVETWWKLYSPEKVLMIGEDIEEIEPAISRADAANPYPAEYDFFSAFEDCSHQGIGRNIASTAHMACAMLMFKISSLIHKNSEQIGLIPAVCEFFSAITVDHDEVVRAVSRVKREQRLLMGESYSDQSSDTSPVQLRMSRKKSNGISLNKTVLLAGSLSYHHDYQNGKCGHSDPVVLGDLAKKLPVSKGTVSNFFKKYFGGHEQYKIICKDHQKLAVKLSEMNDDFPEMSSYGRIPPTEGISDED